LQYFQEGIRLRFDDDAMPDHIEGFVLSGSLPALLIRIVFACSQRLQSILPGPLTDSGVAAGKIGFGNLQVEHRLAFGLIPGLDDLQGFLFVAGLQTGALAASGVHAIKGAASVATAD
jgi:hypothetical protein